MGKIDEKTGGIIIGHPEAIDDTVIYKKLPKNKDGKRLKMPPHLDSKKNPNILMSGVMSLNGGGMKR